MRSTSVLSAAALCLVSACSDNIPVEPNTAALSAFSSRASLVSSDAELTAINPAIENIPAELGAPAGEFVVSSAQLLYDVEAVKGASPTLILANDRMKLTAAQWVKNDPRRGGHDGLKWGYLAANVPVPMFDPSVQGSIRAATPSELESGLVSAVGAWDARSCSSEPFTRLFPGQPGTPDVIQVGWQPNAWFVAMFGPNGSSIIGVTLTSIFVNNLVDKIPTDIDGNGRPDLGQAVIVYNAGKIWADNGPLGTVDLFSIAAHETGHALGIGHFGKVFVNKKNVLIENGVPTISLEDIKYAPKALMNAVYVTGRSDILGTDHSSFCEIWAGR